MGFVLLGVEGLATILLLAAAVIAVAARRRHRWAQCAVAILVLPLPVTLLVGAASALVQFRGGPNQLSGTAVTWGTIYCGGIALANLWALTLLIVGLWRRGALAEPRARAWKPVRLAAAGAAAALLAVVTVWTQMNALSSRIAALRAEAGTLALAAAPARLPDYENAAPLYIAAAELLKDRSIDWDKLDALSAADKLDPNDPDLQSFLKHRAAGLDLVRQATALPGCRFDFLPSQEVGTLDTQNLLGTLDAVNHIRLASWAVALQARIVAAQSGSQAAIPYLNELMRMGRHAAATPDANAILVAAAVESAALKTLDRILAQGAPPAGAPVFDFYDPPILYRYYLQRALQAEEALVYGRLAGISEDAMGFGLLLLDDELAANHALFRWMARELAKPYPECLSGWDHIQARFENTPGVLYRLGIQAYAKMLPAVARADASRRVAQFAVAVASYRANEGHMPARAEDVVPKYLPQVPPDPFTSEPLKLKATADGVVVYSVGPDGVDDGGQPLNDERPPKGDIRVRIGERK